MSRYIHYKSGSIDHKLRIARLICEDTVEYRGSTVLVLRMLNDKGHYSVVPGRLISYKSRKTNFGLSISTVSEIEDVYDQRELVALVKNEEDSSEPRFWAKPRV